MYYCLESEVITLEKDFQDFLQSYMNGDFQKLVETQKGKMQFDFSTPEKTASFLEKFESEILNCNINLLYAYHQWLKSHS